jgi:hypothetical protein
MAATTKALRRIGADAPRPERTLTDELIERIQLAGDSLSRWAWTVSYARAERRYWPPQGENQE